MEQYLSLTKRNLKIYLKDKGAVFFSLLSMAIVIGLMIFFLGDMTINAIANILEKFPGRDAVADKGNATLMVLTWTSAGIISINAVTVTLAAYSVMIKDRVTGKLNSIYTAPISRTIIAASYISAAWVASVIVCTLTLIILEMYGVSQGLEAFTVKEHALIFVMIMINSFVYAGIMYLLAMISKTEGAWSGLGTVVGTLVGFLGGIYIPIGTLSNTIGNIMKCTPVIYGCSMFRQVMTNSIMEKTFDGIPETTKADIIRELNEELGTTLQISDHLVSVNEEMLLLAVVGVAFLAISVIVLKYSKKTDR